MTEQVSSRVFRALTHNTTKNTIAATAYVAKDFDTAIALVAQATEGEDVIDCLLLSEADQNQRISHRVMFNGHGVGLLLTPDEYAAVIKAVGEDSLAAMATVEQIDEAAHYFTIRDSGAKLPKQTLYRVLHAYSSDPEQLPGVQSLSVDYVYATSGEEAFAMIETGGIDHRLICATASSINEMADDLALWDSVQGPDGFLSEAELAALEADEYFKQFEDDEQPLEDVTGVETAKPTFAERVFAMNRMYKQPVLDTPQLPENFAQRLQGFKNTISKEVSEVDDIIVYQQSGGAETDPLAGLTMMADWLGDIVVYCRSEAAKYGIPLEEVLEIIMDSNESKLGADGEPIYDEDGAFKKGPSYWKPEPKIRELLARRIEEAGEKV